MRLIINPALIVASAALVLGLLVPSVLGHGGDENMDMGTDMDMQSGMIIGVTEPQPEVDFPQSYFSYPEHRGTLLAHISLMLLAWVVVLPIGKSASSQGTTAIFKIEFSY